MKQSQRTAITTLLVALVMGSCGGASKEGVLPPDLDTSDLSLTGLPLRFHILQSDHPDLNAQLSDESAVDLLAGVNDFWSIADIWFGVESIRRPVVLDAGDYLAAAESGMKGPAALAAMATVVPNDLLDPGWNVVVTQSMINLPPGVYLTGKRTVLMALETPVGVGGEPGLLAHELGHSLGLMHVDGSDSFNIMASGPGTAPPWERNRLNDEQIAIATEQALMGCPKKQW